MACPVDCPARERDSLCALLARIAEARLMRPDALRARARAAVVTADLAALVQRMATQSEQLHANLADLQDKLKAADASPPAKSFTL